MTSLMPETIEPATGTLPLPKAKKARVSWTQAAVADLVLRSVEPGFDATVVEHAKLVELGMRRKPAKVTLDGHVQSLVDEMLATVAGELEDPQRTLAIRYAIKVFTDALPKRASK
jgi:hypothetical protein